MMDTLLKAKFFLYLFCFAFTIALHSSVEAKSESVGVEFATQSVFNSIDTTYTILNGLSEANKNEINTDVRLLAHTISYTLERLQKQNLSIVSHDVIDDVHFLADIMRAVSYELRTLNSTTPPTVDHDVVGQIEGLSAAASKSIAQIEHIVDQWDKKERDYLVKISQFDGMVTIKYLNRISIDAVRYIGTTLLLFGLLFIAIAIRMERSNKPIGEFFFQKSFFPSHLLLFLFFSACAVLIILPGLLAGLSADIEVFAEEDSCRILQNQSHQLQFAQQHNSMKLVELTKERMELAAANCLGVAAATAAVERLSTKMASNVTTQSLPKTLDPSTNPKNDANLPLETTLPLEEHSGKFWRDYVESSLLIGSDQVGITMKAPKQPKTESNPSTNPRLPDQPIEPKATKDDPDNTVDGTVSAEITSAVSTKKTPKDRPISKNQDTRPETIKQASMNTVAKASLAMDVELYLHFKSADDREPVEELGDILREEGFKVSGIQLVTSAMTTGDIRYRHQNQEDNVENIRSIAEKYFNGERGRENLSINAFYIGDIYPDLPKNVIEIWIPKLTNT